VPLGARRLAVLDRLLLGRRGTGVVRLSGRLEAELAYGRLTFQKVAAGEAAAALDLEPGTDTTVGEVRIRVKSATATGVERGGWETALAPGRYVARTWRPGDRIRPLGGRGSRAVGVLFREARIPPRRRRAWPVIASSDDATIVWVPGICRSDDRIPASGTEALHVECAFT
jgi:tRNA(Ile)-lysidine synthase